MADQIDEIKQKTDIVSIIGEYVDLKKSGSNYKGLCPFHSEKTPSFMVSPELQIYKCFGCGEGGDVISFLQEYEGMEFYETLKHLAEKAGVKLKPLKGGFSKKNHLYKVNNQVSHFYNYVLTKHKAGKKALKYLTDKRKIKKDTIKKFKLGFSPDKPLALKSFLVDKKGYEIKDLKDAGIVYSKSGRSFDRFRGRIIFPLYDHRNNVVGFAGRLLPGSKKDLAKYINTPETSIYHKSKILYGLNIAKGNIKRVGFAVVVEGEIDMISCWQAGVKNVVAINGSALTADQVKLLSRYTDKLVLALDADIAGNEAAKKGIQIADKEGLEIKVVELGKYKDPDEIARKDPQKLNEFIKEADDVWDFLIDSVFDKHKSSTGEAKARISREVVPILSSIEDKIVQAHYVDLVAKRLKVPAEAVAQQIAKSTIPKKASSEEKSIPQKSKKTRRQLLEERLLAIGFKTEPEILNDDGVISLFKANLATRLLGELKDYGGKEFDIKDFSDNLPEELAEGFADLVMREDGFESDKPESFKKEFDSVKKELEELNIREELSSLAEKIKKLEQSKKKDKLKRAEEKFDKLTKELGRLQAPKAD